MEKHFTTLETDFTLETLLPWRKGTLFLNGNFSKQVTVKSTHVFRLNNRFESLESYFAIDITGFGKAGL